MGLKNYNFQLIIIKKLKQTVWAFRFMVGCPYEPEECVKGKLNSSLEHL